MILRALGRGIFDLAHHKVCRSILAQDKHQLSETQFREMTNAGVQLVVPAGLTETFPEDVRPHLQALDSFIGDARVLNVGISQ